MISQIYNQNSQIQMFFKKYF